ncbi:MAG: hypothetical protein EA415_02000 [Sphaerobacteraceae bacterium]|nr:MAG: hypothetical protein EA415_02000 [Sphaerobacteraceae bacterium]
MFRPPPDAAEELEPGVSTETLRSWLLSAVGAIIVWLIALGAMLPASLGAILILPETYSILLLGAGLWLVLGLAAIHWYIPPDNPSTPHAEGLAIAGWHILTTLISTGFFAWVLLFPDGRRPVFTIGDVVPVVVVGGILLVMFGIIFTLMRGYEPMLGLRRAYTVLCLLTVWMTLWLVAAHGGL